MIIQRQHRLFSRFKAVVLVALVVGSIVTTEAFLIRHHQWATTTPGLARCTGPADDDDRTNIIRVYAMKVKQSRSSKRKDLTSVEKNDDYDDETPAGIVGAQFFGGNKEKELFYDPVAELEAGIIVNNDNEATTTATTYDRFADRSAFPDTYVASVAESIQDQINQVLYGDETVRTAMIPMTCSYAPTLQWDTVFPKTSTRSSNITPLQELETALNFYRRLNVAVISGEKITVEESSSNTVVQLRWEISVMWPTLWEPRIVLTGQSRLTINAGSNQIIQQTDTLDDTDFFGGILRQYLPRFWDVYHIGMTPAAEVSPIINIGKKWTTWLTSRYQLREIPPRIVVQASINDSDDRDDNNASILPNHAFTCVIKTMGPEKQFYTPATGVQVRLIPRQEKDDDQNRQRRRLQIQWNIPIATEYVSNPILQLPPVIDASNCDDHEFTREDLEQYQPTCQYTYVPRRFVATIPYAGKPQDPDITKVRKELYDQIIRDGYQPKMDPQNQRPIFFFTMNSVKACYTNEGLGMAVYEWRPQFTKPNEIGIELEIV